MLQVARKIAPCVRALNIPCLFRGVIVSLFIELSVHFKITIVSSDTVSMTVFNELASFSLSVIVTSAQKFVIDIAIALP